MNWIDYVIVGIVLINVGFGWYKGLIRSLTNIVSLILGLIAAKLFHPQLYVFLDEKFGWYLKIKTAVANTFSNIQFPKADMIQSVPSEQLSDSIGGSEYVRTLLQKFFESESFQNLKISGVTDFSDGFSSWLANNLLNILSMILVFLLVFVAVRIGGYLLSKVFKLPLLRGVNKLSGLAFGTVKGILFAMLFVIIVVVFGPLFSGIDTTSALETSLLGIYFYKYNIFMIIFESMI